MQQYLFAMIEYMSLAEVTVLLSRCHFGIKTSYNGPNLLLECPISVDSALWFTRSAHFFLPLVVKLIVVQSSVFLHLTRVSSCIKCLNHAQRKDYTVVDKVLIFEGNCGSEDNLLDSVLQFDIGTNQFEVMPQLPFAVSNLM